MKPTNTNIMHTFKIIASKAGNVVFDDRVEAETPREAREKMKKALGLESLTGVVYAITEIPTDLIREIVAAQIAEVVVTARGRKEIDLPALINSTVALVADGKFRELEARLAAPESGKAKAWPTRFDPLVPSGTPAESANAPTKPDTEPIRAILGPNWKEIRRYYERTRKIKETAAQFNVSPNTLKTRIRRKGWGK